MGIRNYYLKGDRYGRYYLPPCGLAAKLDRRYQRSFALVGRVMKNFKIDVWTVLVVVLLILFFKYLPFIHLVSP
jgi:hypothetical protein